MAPTLAEILIALSAASSCRAPEVRAMHLASARAKLVPLIEAVGHAKRALEEQEADCARSMPAQTTLLDLGGR